MYPVLINIETATEVCSVALSKGEDIVSSIYSDKGNSHTEHLFPFIQEVLDKGNCKISEINGVALSIGPGSYTGLRIGASAAKGICYALNIPLIGVSTLQSIVFGAKSQPNTEQNVLFCPMIDARRMEVFAALFDTNGEAITDVESKIVDESAFLSELNSNIICFCGNGMPKCKPFLQHQNARFVDVNLNAANMLTQALHKFSNKQFEDVAYFEPFYLKEYLAKKSVVKGL